MNTKIKIILPVLAGVAMLSVVVGSGFATALVPPNHTDYSYKHAVCLGKVLGLARIGIVRDAPGYYSAIDACMNTVTSSSIYWGYLTGRNVNSH
jgi:hypothetical protein